MGDRPVHYAVYNQYVDIVSYFIEIGANVEIENNRGFTPLDISDKVENRVISLMIQRVLDKLYGRKEAKQAKASEKAKTVQDLLQELEKKKKEEEEEKLRKENEAKEEKKEKDKKEEEEKKVDTGMFVIQEVFHIV